MSDFEVVTGAFGYTGRAIARQLLDRGIRVRTLTGHPARPNEFGDRIEVHPFNFDYPEALVESLRGVRVLYNTYWVRFPRGKISFEKAVRNTTRLFEAARIAGVERVVHISISNPYAAPELPYFQGKASLEGAIATSGLSYAVVRPTVLFGEGDVFINNIAWLLRRFPMFPIPGTGDYHLQPIYVGDVAEICIDAAGRTDDLILDAAGPETFTFEGLLRLVSEVVESRTAFVHVPAWLALWLARAVGFSVRDVVLTDGELRGLMAETIVSNTPPLGSVVLSEWLHQNASDIGQRYASELSRNYRTGLESAGQDSSREVVANR